MSGFPTGTVSVGAVQCSLAGPREANIARVEAHVRDAAAKGAQIVLPPELFEGPYFCREEIPTGSSRPEPSTMTRRSSGCAEWRASSES